ncbi:MAG: alpha-galactosidase [Oscillospiraceae bacterium]|nr:alpha-galactosidase [Oscillospiraceae bacterium]
MGITFDPTSKTLTLTTRSSAYQMQIGPLGHLLHLYYGPRAADCFSYLYPPRDVGFSPNPAALRAGRGWSLDTQPQEYSASLCGDYRLSSLEFSTDEGLRGADLRYQQHTVSPGKYALPGLPSARGAADTESLSVTLRDAATGVEVELRYGVYETDDFLTRAVRIRNGGSVPLRLEKAASLCLDLPFGDWELLHFFGSHTMERQPERVPVARLIQTVSSRRGFSSHQQNPFVILCAPDTTERSGESIGVMPVWSGSHETSVERSQTGAVRLVSGIGSADFSWRLLPGETFQTPEVLLSYSAAGLSALSQSFHRFLRTHVARPGAYDRPRPVLLNSWEASYFDFDRASILRLARDARDLGVELLVLDDGWFGSRDDDRRALGDWFAHPRKLPGGLGPLIREVCALGLRFGLWVEPEMLSEDSELYRAHPDWALTVPGREPTVGRDQLVLDLGRREVRDWLYETFSALLREHPISYIKWDANRNLSDLYSRALPPERQGETAHRYLLGLYALLERLCGEFPDVLFEGCAGGGGRFDAGMLPYFPQIWCSDNTDPISRLAIQRGSSYGYPPVAMACHVSASPNHQTGRSSPLGTRGVVAMTGAFGYELDPAALSEEAREEVRQQIRRYRELEALLRCGDYYRLETAAALPLTAWQFVSPDRRETLLSLVQTEAPPGPIPLHLRLRGLDPEASYRLIWMERFGCPDSAVAFPERWSGAALLHGGLVLPPMPGDYPSARLLFRADPGTPRTAFPTER